MVYIIFLVIIVLGLGGIVAVVIKKLPQLTTLDVDNLPAEKEARKKKEIIMKRVEAEGIKMHERWSKQLRPFAALWGRLQLQFRVYVGRVERLWRHEQRQKVALDAPLVSAPSLEAKVQESLQHAEQLLAASDYERAEEAFIATITLDQTSARAYRGLGDAYLAREQLKEARETFLFLLQHLEPENDAVMAKLAEIEEAEGNAQEAINYYQQAVLINDALSPRFYHLAELLVKIGQPASAKEAIVSALQLEPKNPKYLDLLIETGIQCGDKNAALQAYGELRLVNPENQKLKSFKDRIYRL